MLIKSGQNSPKPGLSTVNSEQSLNEPRSVRGLFALAATSSTFTPEELVAEVQRVLIMLNLHYVQVCACLPAGACVAFVLHYS